MCCAVVLSECLQIALGRKAPVELGESQKSQIIAPYGSGIKEIQFSKEDNENEDIVTASVNIAPLYSTKVNSVEQSEQVHNSELYKKYKQNNERLAKMFNLEVVSQEDGVGGYEFSNGDAVMEATTVVNVKGKFSDIVNYAAINGALTPEVQDATIAGMYVDASDKNHNADKISVKIVCNLKFVKGHITSTPIKFRKLVSTTEYAIHLLQKEQSKKESTSKIWR